MMKKALSIRFRLLRAITITIISIIGFISAVVGYELYKRNTALFNEFTAQQFFNVEKSINLLMQKGENVVTMLASHPAVRGADDTIYNYTIEAQKSGRIYTHTGKTEQELVTLFKAIEESFSEFQDVYMGTRWGGIATSWSGEDELGYDPRQRSWYKQAAEANGAIVITPVYIATDGTPVVAVAKAIKDGNGTLLGCVGVDINLSDLTSFISSVKIGNTGYCMLVQDDGMILADAAHSAFISKNLSDVDAAFAKITQKKEGSVFITLDGKQRKAYIFPFPELRWKLIVIVEQREILSLFYALVRIMVLIGLAMFVFYFTLAILASRALKRYFARLETLFGKIAAGDLTDRVAVKRNNEIGRLMTNLNMAIEHTHTSSWCNGNSCSR